MGILIEQQAVIDCLNNTAEYYAREDADEWTRGMRYGLLHGVDSILDDVSPVEAIPKDQYEARLKADMVAILTEIQLEIKELWDNRYDVWLDNQYYIGKSDTLEEVDEVIQQKINVLKGGENDTSGKAKT